MIIFNLLNVNYKLELDSSSFQELLHNSIYSTNEDQISENHQNEEEINQEPQLDIETLKQVQLEDDGIILGSETTTEASEYSEDLIEEEDIDDLILNCLKVLSSLFLGLPGSGYSYGSSSTNKYLIKPTEYAKNFRLNVIAYIEFLDNWIKKTHNFAGKLRFKNIDKYIRLSMSSYGNEKSFLLKLKYSQFSKLSGEDQIDFLNKLDVRTLQDLSFKVSEYNEDIIACMLKRRFKNVTRVQRIADMVSGLWGNFFFSRPFPKPRVSIEEQYNEPKWLKRAEKYEQAIDLIYGIIQSGEEDITAFAKFLQKSTSKNFSFFIRSMLKPELGYLTKEVKFEKIKREDFLPFKIDFGFKIALRDVNEIDNADLTYIYQKMPLDKDFQQNQKFYIHGPNSICTRTDLKKTRDELQEYPDDYLYDLGVDNGDDDDEEFAFDPAILQRNERAHTRMQQNRERNNEANGKANKEEDEIKKLYRLKKYSILEFRKRGQKRLQKREMYDKADNRVSTDMLRAGLAIIRKLRYPPTNNFDWGYEDRHWFIRNPLYYMFVPAPFPGNQVFKKFWVFKHIHFSTTVRMEMNDIHRDYSNDYECLYVKRLKKVVLRAKVFRNRLIETKTALALERVHCGGKVVNLDDPEQREPYYRRLFQFNIRTIKYSQKQGYLDQQELKILKTAIKPCLFTLHDFTLRRIVMAKLDCILKHYSGQSKNIKILEKDGKLVMKHSQADSRAQKVMPEGEKGYYEPLNKHAENGPEFEKNTQHFTNFIDSFNNEPMSYEYIRYSNATGSRYFDPKTQISISWRTESRGNNYYDPNIRMYYNRPMLWFVGKHIVNGDKGQRCFQVYKNGQKTVFRFLVEEDTRLAVSTVFRKLYLLKVGSRDVGLRVVTFDAIAKYLKKKVNIDACGSGE